MAGAADILKKRKPIPQLKGVLGVMTKGVMGFMKGVGMGVAVGCIAGAVGSRAMHGKKSLKKNVGKALRNVGELVDNVPGMF